jgi:uncharacterized protein
VPGGVSGVWEVPTPGGPARVHLHAAPHGRPRATLVLGHGAGGGVAAPDLVAIAEALPAEGIEVALVEQPWRVAGRRVAGPPASLDAAWVAVLADLRSRGIGRRRLVAGGRSTGARVACRTVGAVEPAALLLLAFPVHPLRQPVTQPAPSRLPELVGAARAVPTVVLQGDRDRMGVPDEIAVALSEADVTARVVPIPGADHAFRVTAKGPGTQAEALDLVVRAARATALRIISGRY